MSDARVHKYVALVLKMANAVIRGYSGYNAVKRVAAPSTHQEAPSFAKIVVSRSCCGVVGEAQGTRWTQS
jgi:hypothetical protein